MSTAAPRPFGELAAQLLDMLGPGPLVVGVGGGVAAGKSTLAAALAAASDPEASIVSLDSFLHPNRVLEERGAVARKGWPDTYDMAAIEAFLDRIRHEPVRVPLYSHEIYDIVEGEAMVVVPAPLVVVEGLHAVNPAVRAGLDRTVYLHADEQHLRRWFVHRFVDLVEAARTGGGGFYGAFVDMDRSTVMSLAEATWDTINGPNVATNVAPTRDHADVVVTLGPEREVVAVEGVEIR